MTQYLLSMIQRGETPPADLDLDRVMRDLDAIRAEMKAAGAWVFSGGLHAPSTATVVRYDHDEVLTTDGPFAEASEYIGGFTIVDARDLDAALEWGGKLARATTLPIEVRPFRERR